MSVSIDGVTDSDSVSTDRSNLMYGVGGEFASTSASASGSAGIAMRNVGSDDQTGEVDIDLISLGLRYNFD